MSVKQRLQRVLQILEESERMGMLSELERDFVLGELREAYSEIKFITPSATLVPLKQEDKEQRTENEEQSEIIPIAPNAPTEKVEADEEPEVEVELIFEEESEDTQNEETENEEQSEISTTNSIAHNSPIVEEELSTLNSQLSTPKRSPLLSLYEESTPVIGEQFHEKPSVADTIACPKGVAEKTPVILLREAIGVADKFMLIRELFNGDSDAYEEAIDVFETLPSFDDCIIFITEHYTWSPNSQATKLVMDLLQRKYN